MPASSDNSRNCRARFLVLEGVDGSGKSTQASRLAAWYQERGCPVVLTREPGGTELGERLRALIKDECGDTPPCAPRTELLLTLAARAQHVAEVIDPALSEGVTVISDRFSLSTLAYQGAARGLPLADIRAADAVATQGVRPDLTLVIDVPLEVAQARTGQRFDRFEREGPAFLQKVIDGYREIGANEPNVRFIEGSGTVDEVWQAVRQAVERM